MQYMWDPMRNSQGIFPTGPCFILWLLTPAPQVHTSFVWALAWQHLTKGYGSHTENSFFPNALHCVVPWGTPQFLYACLLCICTLEISCVEGIPFFKKKKLSFLHSSSATAMHGQHHPLNPNIWPMPQISEALQI